MIYTLKIPKRKMVKSKIREIIIKESKGTFGIIKDTKISKKDYAFSGLSALRHLLSNERARMLHVIKTQKPTSIYGLAKKLGRSFKSVTDDVQLLKRFGFIELRKENTKNRIRHKPVIVVDHVTIHLKI